MRGAFHQLLLILLSAVVACFAKHGLNLLLNLPSIYCETLNLEMCKPHEEPKIVAPLTDVSARESQTVYFSCNVSHLGNYQITWVKTKPRMKLIAYNNDQLFTTDAYSKYQIIRDGEVWRLQINDVRKDDEGAYRCSINSVPVIYSEAKLALKYPPTLIKELSTGTQVEAREGSNVTLRCRARGHPPPKYSWRRGDARQEGGTPPHLMIMPHGQGGGQYSQVHEQDLTLEKISREQSGPYRCIVKNGIEPDVVWTIRLNVEFPPVVFPEGASTVEAKYGEKAILRCRMEAYPRCNPVWYKIGTTGNVLITPSRKFEIETSRPQLDRPIYELRSQLRIEPIEKGDFAPYLCECRNNYAVTSATLNLKAATTSQPYDPPGEFVYSASGVGPPKSIIYQSGSFAENKDPDRNRYEVSGRTDSHHRRSSSVSSPPLPRNSAPLFSAPLTVLLGLVILAVIHVSCQ